MLKRLAGLVVTVAGVVLALLVGLWALVFLGVVAVAAALAYAVRSRFMAGNRTGGGNVVEGEFEVLDDEAGDRTRPGGDGEGRK